MKPPSSSLILFAATISSFFLLQGCLFLPAAAQGRDDKKPNIIVIFADDVGTGDVPGRWWRNHNKGEDETYEDMPDMPNLDKLLDEGTTFHDAHSLSKL